MNRKKMLIAIAAVALGIAGLASSAQAGDNQSAAHAATKDKGVNGAFGRTHIILIQRSYYEGSGRSTGPFNPDIGDDFEGYPHPK